MVHLTGDGLRYVVTSPVKSSIFPFKAMELMSQSSDLHSSSGEIHIKL